MIQYDGPGRFDGIPRLVWYATVEKVPAAELRLGMWLDSLDHRGARKIAGPWSGADDNPVRSFTSDQAGTVTAMFFGGDTETLRLDVAYGVVDPDSQVTPDGSAL
jgi:hypothetical protein